jgi:putative membrane protein
MMYWGNGGWGMMLTMIFSNLLFLGLIITGIVLLVRSLGRTGPVVAAPATAGRSTPQMLLAERYARGEIDDDEYAHGLRVLGQSSPSSG